MKLCPIVQNALDTLRSETANEVKGLKKEIEVLKKAGRDRERDLDTLSALLQCNQDVINVRNTPVRTEHTDHTYWRIFLFSMFVGPARGSGGEGAAAAGGG